MGRPVTEGKLRRFVLAFATFATSKVSECCLEFLACDVCLVQSHLQVYTCVPCSHRYAPEGSTRCLEFLTEKVEPTSDEQLKIYQAEDLRATKKCTNLGRSVLKADIPAVRTFGPLRTGAEDYFSQRPRVGGRAR